MNSDKLHLLANRRPRGLAPPAVATGSGLVTQSSKGVFLSYASEDAGAAKRICDALHLAGIEVWFDQSELRGGDAWDQKIRQQIRDCALFVPIISAHTQARPEGYFRLEWKLAVDRSHLMAAEKAFVVPVVVDATTEAEALVPAKFREVQWTRMPGDAAQAAFVDRIAGLLDQPVARHVDGAERAVGRAPPRRLQFALIALSVAAVVALAMVTAVRGGWAWRHSGLTGGPDPASASTSTAPTAISEKSVAVLPFIDMSQGRDQEYFSDGLSEELIDMLTRVPDLRVPARTSSFYFKGKQATVAEIAKTLGVAHVLEGSVRRSGKRIRVTAQLIRVDSGYHIWSETYDRDLDDIFKVQDEIAAAVVRALKVSLLAAASSKTPMTSSTDAYTLYLQAGEMLRRGDGAKAREYLERAIRLDATFASAWARLTQAITGLYESGAIPFEQARDGARDAADHSIAIDPALGAAHLAMARVHAFFDWDWAKAEAEIRRARELDPTDSDALRWAGALALTIGRPRQSLELLRQAANRDPLMAANYSMLGQAYIAVGNLPEAQTVLRKAVDLAPPHGFGSRFPLAVLPVMMGRPAEALANCATSQDDERAECLAIANFALGRRPEADAALTELRTHYAAQNEYAIAAIYAFRGERDLAFAWLDRAYDAHDRALLGLLTDPVMNDLRSDARYKALLRKMRLPE